MASNGVSTGSQAHDDALGRLVEMGITYGLPLALEAIEAGIAALSQRPDVTNEIRFEASNLAADLAEKKRSDNANP